jgi:hypothetical protein
VSARASVAAVVAAALLTAACGGTDAALPPGPAAADLPSPDAAIRSVTLEIVLPPADRLAPAERARVRMLVDRAIDEVVLTGPRPALLEPATGDALLGAVELAVRRSDTVCVFGRDARSALDAALTLYPARMGCTLANGGDGSSVITVDVDVERIGRELGLAARAAAGEGAVLVLAAGDGMLDARWSIGVAAGAAGARHVVTSAVDLLQILDDQAASIAAGLVPGSTAVLDDLDREDVPIALALAPVEVVVLDASVDASLVVAELLDRAVLVIAPRSILVDHPDDPSVVLRWRIRWDVPLAGLLRRVLDRDAPAVDGGDVDLLAVESGPAVLGR